MTRKEKVDERSRTLKWWPFDVKIRKKPKGYDAAKRKKRKARKKARKKEK